MDSIYPVTPISNMAKNTMLNVNIKNVVIIPSAENNLTKPLERTKY